MTEEEKPCSICRLVDEGKSAQNAVEELLTFTGNRTAAFFLSKATGETITAKEIEKHKKAHMEHFSRPFAKIPSLWDSLDFSKKEDRAQAYMLDSLHGLALSPGRTSAYAALQGMKILFDEEKNKQGDTGELLETVIGIVMKNVKDEKDKLRVAEALSKWKKEQDSLNGQ